MKGKKILSVSLLLALTIPVFAQTTPFLNDDQIRMLRNEISGDRAFEHIRVLTQWHRDSGMEGYFKAMDYVDNARKKMVCKMFQSSNSRLMIMTEIRRIIRRKRRNLWMVEPVELKLADIGDHALYLSDNSRDADLTAELDLDRRRERSDPKKIGR